MNVTGNVMTMKHFVDFYYLEALRAGILMAKSAKPEFQFRRAVEKLEKDVNEAFDTLSKTMALRIYVYLWGASLGEAMYASEQCEEAIEELEAFGYTRTFRYFPTEHNVNTVKHIFRQDGWDGSYGGRAWLEIVEGMELYGKITDAAFIDHCVDLEHNGGCVFNKTGEHPFLLNCNTIDFNGRSLHRFLNYKFSDDILCGTYSYDVSRKVYNLVVRYSNIIDTISAVDCLTIGIEWLSPYTVEWNENIIEFSLTECNNGVHCNSCGDTVSEDDAFFVNDEYLCSDCTETCEHCNAVVHKNDASYIDGEDETWCDECKDEFMVTCEECNKDFHLDNTGMTDDDVSLCNECMEDAKCEICDKHYYNMQEHDAEEHPETETLPTKEENITTKIVPFALWKEEPVKTKVYSLKDSPLKVINLKEYRKKKNQTTFINYVIVIPCGLWMPVHKNNSLSWTLETAKKISNMVQWETIKDPSDWMMIPDSKKYEVLKATRG